MKTIFIPFFVIFILSGCATWEGVKKDSSNAWNKTKKTTKNDDWDDSENDWQKTDKLNYKNIKKLYSYL